MSGLSAFVQHVSQQLQGVQVSGGKDLWHLRHFEPLLRYCSCACVKVGWSHDLVRAAPLEGAHANCNVLSLCDRTLKNVPAAAMNTVRATCMHTACCPGIIAWLVLVAAHPAFLKRVAGSCKCSYCFPAIPQCANPLVFIVVGQYHAPILGTQRPSMQDIRVKNPASVLGNLQPWAFYLHVLPCPFSFSLLQ